MTPKQEDLIKARLLAEKKAKEIMEEMDICDKEHDNYEVYQLKLEWELFRVMVKTLNL